MRPPEFYQHWLDVVSRSFALCIPQLAPPFRDEVALAYLLLRVLDTVEDAPFIDRDVQQCQFDRLRAFMRVMPSRAEANEFIAAFPRALADGERALLADTSALLEDAHALPAPARIVIVHAIDRMAKGMAAYTRRPTPLRLVDVEDVSRYCCFVAGVVGEMLTRLWALGGDELAPPIPLAYHFGLFLQKVNILKDQAEDEAAGRFLIPDRAGVLASLRGDARGALDYLQALPPGRDRGYRTFCAWSLMLGAATVSQLDQPKLSRRAETAALLARTGTIVHDNAALAQQFAELLPPLPAQARTIPMVKPESGQWFRDTLAAPLSEADLRRLGVVHGPIS